MKKEGYIKTHYDLFLGSFRSLTPKIFIMAFFDLIFYVMLPLIILSPFNFLQGKVAVIESRLPDFGVEMGFTAAESLASDMMSLFILIILFIILSFILIVLDFTIIKGLIWGMIFQKKFNFRFFRRFFILNFLSISCLVIILILIGVLFLSEPVTFLGITFNGISSIYQLIFFTAWIYFSNILFTFFMDTEPKKAKKKFLEKVKSSVTLKVIKRSFIFSFKKFPFLFLPYVILMAIFILLIFIIRTLIAFFPEAYAVGLTIIILLLLFYLSWARYYIIGVIKKA